MPKRATGSRPAAEDLERRVAALEAANARLQGELAAVSESAARLDAILKSARDYAIITFDRQAAVTSWNAGAEHLLGWSAAEAMGMDARAIFTPEDREAGAADLEMSRAATLGHAENERWHQRKDGTRFWGSGVIVPLDGQDGGGAAAGRDSYLKILRDRTEQHAAQERQAQLLHELAHRVKNTLALVMAMVRLTGRQRVTLTAFLDRFEARLRALAAVHDLLSQSGWQGSSLKSVLRSVQAVHELDGRLALDLADVELRPDTVQDIMLALHELAANARLHGSLAHNLGEVKVTARVERGRLVLTWRESGGPAAVTAPAGHGFGLTLVGRMSARHDGGATRLDWPPEGLVCTIELPLPATGLRTPTGTGVPG